MSMQKCRMDSREGVCQLDLMLVWEAFDSKEAALLYPVNSLRNYARMQVESKSSCRGNSTNLVF